MSQKSKCRCVPLFILIAMICVLGAGSGCSTGKGFWKSRSPLFRKHPKKDALPEAPLFSEEHVSATGKQNASDLIEQAGYIRNGSVPHSQENGNSDAAPKKKWYQKPLFRSDRAEQISENLGK